MNNTKNAKKKWTAERLETFIDTEVAIEHLHRYAIALDLVRNKRVLDIASGEGYGSNLMAMEASEVTGVDISSEAIFAAKKKYTRKNLQFLQGSASDIPYESDYFDVVVSFETIEHHDQHEKMLLEIKRVLKDDGLLIISSPDKFNYSDKRSFQNKFHVKELYNDEFKVLIYKNFQNAGFYYQRAVFASLIIPDESKLAFKEFSGDYEKINDNKSFDGLYIIAVASNGSLPEMQISAFTDEDMIQKLTNAERMKVWSTISYKLGHIILWPLKTLYKIFR